MRVMLVGSGSEELRAEAGLEDDVAEGQVVGLLLERGLTFAPCRRIVTGHGKRYPTALRRVSSRRNA
jgi:hypothetical protein